MNFYLIYGYSWECKVIPSITKIILYCNSGHVFGYNFKEIGIGGKIGTQRTLELVDIDLLANDHTIDFKC